MSSTNRGAERQESNNYPTPAWCVHRFLEATILPPGHWLEPSAGEGGIIRAVESVRSDVRWSACEIRDTEADLRASVRTPFEFYFPRTDFLTLTTSSRWDVVLGNAPYCDETQAHIEKALGLAGVVAFLLRLNFLGSEGRAPFFRAHPPSVYVLPNRPSFVGGKTDSCEYAWFAWGLNFAPEIRVLATTPKSVRCRREALK